MSSIDYLFIFPLIKSSQLNFSCVQNAAIMKWSHLNHEMYLAF